jgi:hypothetical protein
MSENSLEKFIASVQKVWGPLSTDVISACQLHLAELAKTSATEEWLAKLHRDAAGTVELYRDSIRGFLLLAHTETTALYRPPHDHGRSWVMYALQRGESEMRSYAQTKKDDGTIKLVRRDATLVTPGRVMVYLPGDIYDTRCVSGPSMLFRFTERDLHQDEKEGHKVTRYVDKDGDWTLPTGVLVH